MGFKQPSFNHSRTEVGDAMKKHNMSSDEKREYNKKRFPSKVK